MISWHRVGQKVVSIDCVECPLRNWARYACVPLTGEFTISRVMTGAVFNVGFQFAEAGDGIYASQCVRPVYPHVIDQLRKLDAPSPELERDCERVKEGV